LYSAVEVSCAAIIFGVCAPRYNNIIILIIVVSYTAQYRLFFYFVFLFFLCSRFVFSPSVERTTRMASHSQRRVGARGADAIPPRRNSESKYQSFRVVSGPEGAEGAASPSAAAADLNTARKRRGRTYRKSAEEGVQYTHNALRSLVYTARHAYCIHYVRAV